MNKQFPRFTSFLLMCLTFSLTATAQVVDIPDPNLRAAVETALGKASGAAITVGEMATLSHLEEENANIIDLTGLEHAINLKELRLSENNISEISALSGLVQLQRLLLGGNSISNISVVTGLTQLTRLSLYGNNVSDLSPVKALTYLTELNLSGNSISSISPVAGLTNLKWLHLQSNRISDIAALTGLTNLTAMRLDRNSISDISALSGLTQLKELRLDRNNITDLSPLVANTGLGNGAEVDVQENPLSHTSIKTHIPTLQSRGVTVEFDDATHLNFGEPRTVRLIYFIPSDRSPQQDIDTKLDTLIRDVQQFYANEMERHGFGGKTFTFETDVTGKAVVHHVEGQFNDSYYHQDTFRRTWKELIERFDMPTHAYWVVIDTSIERIVYQGSPNCGEAADVFGEEGKREFLMPASGKCFNFKVAAHELGHTFGLRHDLRNNAYIMSYEKREIQDRISKCAAEWLEVHSFFNSNQTVFNIPTTIRLLPPLAYSPKAIRLRFEVTDPDGLHQAQLIIPTIAEDPARDPKLHGCKRLNGESNTIEFITTELTVEPATKVRLHVIDTQGNITKRGFTFTKTDVLPDQNDRIPTMLEKISGDNQDGLSITPLPKPLVVEITDQNGIELEEAIVTFIVTAGRGTLSATRTMTDENGRAQSTLTLGPNLGINTVQVSAAGITVTFNAVAGLGVDIPDPNLRDAIETALGKASGAPITAGEMATLTELNARDASISDLTGLGFATNLITLRLHNNRITDISPLSSLTELRGLYLDNSNIADISPLSGLIHLEALGLGGNEISDIAALSGLTNLTRLRLGHNHISDLSPLVANTGLGSGDTVDVQENPLSHTSIKTHIPRLQSRGVTVEFDDTTHLNFGEPRTVRLIYFLPSDRSPQRDIDTKLDRLIEDVQQFYADEMERHGFGQKTFTFETDATGKAVVHHVDGQFTDSYYRQNTFRKVWDEIREQFYTPQNIHFIAIDIGNERVGRGYNEVCGVGDSHGASGGHVLFPASGDCFDLKTAAHELGHAFGLQHDFRSDTYIMSLGNNPNKMSECTAEWLTAHRYFNTGQSQTHFDTSTTIQMLSPFGSPPYAIGLRFEVTDPDGAHQAQLLTPATIRNQDRGQPKLLSCKRLNGETNTIGIEFITNGLTAYSHEVTLSVIDVHGNVTSQTHPIDIATILPTKTTSIPDRNQVVHIPEPVPPPFTVRDAFELDPFYQQWSDVEGFPVLASANVSSYAVKEAAWLIRQMIGHRQDVLHVLVQKSVRFVVIGYTEVLTDIPEYRDHRPDFVSYVLRGLGGSGLSGHPAVSSSEENLLHYSGEGLYNVLIHEFAHVIHRFGLNTIDPTFDNRLKIVYDAAMEKGLWQGTYASSDRREYWAEGTQAWFYPKGASSFNRNTRQALKAYDPGLAALLAEIYGDDEWRYTPPAARTHLPHLQGFNPQDSPTFQGFPELEELHRQFKNPNSDGGDKWVDLRPYDPSLLPSLNESRTAGPRRMVGFINLTQVDVLVYWVSYNGTQGFWTRIYPQRIRVTPAIANEIWLIKDLNGRNLAVFQALEKTGRILIDEVPILITPGLSKVSGDNQSGVPGAILGNPFVIEVRDENGAVLEGIPVTFAVTTGGGTLSVTHTKTDENSQAESTFTLGTNLGANTVSVSAGGIAEPVIFNALAIEPVNVPDPNLRAAIATVLGRALDDPIVPSEMATLMELNARDASISNLTGLEFATNLTTLRLHNNRITDISPLSSLTELRGLYLDNSNIADISPLSGLIHLGALGLGGNEISDIAALSGLTNLTRLRLGHNHISDLSPLVANTGLESGDTVDVRGNPLSHLSIHTHISTLQSRGVEVNFDSQTPPVTADVNNDGSVNVLDLIVITSNLNTKGTNLAADVNRDGVVNILDLVLAAGMFDVAVAAPAAQPQVPETLTAVEVHGWLTDARTLEVRDPLMKRGFLVLEQLLVSLTPKETELLANYPNPFNPETWIPYRLAEDAFVTLTIYDPSGHVIRTLDVGHQIASAYENRSKAIYWDGKNNLGEQVASGIYFYQLRAENSRSETEAGDYTATRKMVILK